MGGGPGERGPGRGGAVFSPFMTGMMALATGLGVGGSSAVSRRIGAQDKPGAEKAALSHPFPRRSLALLFLLGVPLAPALFSLLGAAGKVAELAASYARVLFGGAVVLFFANLATALSSRGGRCPKGHVRHGFGRAPQRRNVFSHVGGEWDPPSDGWGEGGGDLRHGLAGSDLGDDPPKRDGHGGHGRGRRCSPLFPPFHLFARGFWA